MKIGIISAERTPDDRNENSRLVDEITARGHQPQIINYLNTTVCIEGDSAELMEYSGDLTLTPVEADIVIPRINEGDFSSVVLGIMALETLMHNGSRSTAEPNAMLVAKDKARAQLAFVRAGLHTPQAAIPLASGVPHPETILQHVEPDPHYKVVIKDRWGTLGDEVRILDSRASAVTVTGSIYTPQVVQRFIESPGYPELISDHRIIVIGGRAVAGFIRQVSSSIDLRANVSQNGEAIEYDPSDEERHLAETAVKAVGLKVAGVDVFPPTDKHTFLINEVNASPGFGIGDVPKLNIPGAIVDYALSIAEH